MGAGGARDPGETGGAAEVTLTVAQMPAHAGHADSNVGNAVTGSNALYPSRVVGGNTIGGDAPHENLPPFFAIAYALQVE
jgi:microcystin-dependent protein